MSTSSGGRGDESTLVEIDFTQGPDEVKQCRGIISSRCPSVQGLHTSSRHRRVLDQGQFLSNYRNGEIGQPFWS